MQKYNHIRSILIFLILLGASGLSYGQVNSNSLPITQSYSGRTVTYTSVSLNGGGNTINVEPGASITFSTAGTYTHTSGYCPGCIVQIYARMNDVFNLCLVNGGTSGGGSFSGSTTFTAPSTPDTYYVNPTGSLDYFCHDSKSVSPTFGSSTLATIVVASPDVDIAQGNIANGAYHTAAILSDGSVKVWGNNDSGQLGQGNTNNIGDGASEMGDNLSAVDLGTGRTAVRIAAGVSHTAVILDDGSVKAWGSNTYGQLGQGNATTLGDGAGELGDNLSAVDLGTGRTAVAIAAGDNHTAVILDDGNVKVWGQNTYGQLGQGNTNQIGDAAGEMGDNLSAVDLGTGRTAVAIAAGGSNTAVILDDGSVKVWGHNTFGQGGQGHTNTIGDDSNEMGDNLLAVNLGTGKTALDIAVGQYHTAVILNDSTIKAWGHNTYGQLGQGNTNQLGDEPGEMGDALQTVASGIKALAIAAGATHTIAILHDGTVVTAGQNSYGQLGLGSTDNMGDDTSDQLTTVNLGTGRTATAISGGYSHTSVILDNCNVKAWGVNNVGQLGQGNTDALGDGEDEMGDDLSAVDMGTGKCGATTLTLISSGPSITFNPDNGSTNVAPTTNIIIQFNEAIRKINDSQLTDTNVDELITLKDTDVNGSDIVFDATINSAKNAIIINPTVNFSATQTIYVAIGSSVEDLQNNAILAKSVTFTTGSVTPGQLNHHISSGYFTTNVILSDGTVKAWGYNQFGALGQGHTNHIGDGSGEMGNALSSIDLGTGRTAVAIAAGLYHTAAILDNGQVKAWGRNFEGELGQGNTNHLGDGANEMGDNLTAVDLGTGRTAVAIAADHFVTAVILDDGSVRVWGSNAYGQLGQGNTDNIGDNPNEMGNNLSAVDLGTGRTAVAIAVGRYSTGVILDDGSVKVWGNNTFGQLGQGNMTQIGDGANEMGNNLSAVELGTGRTAVAITAGRNHYAVIMDNGSVKTWGEGTWGQLGQEHNSIIGNGANEMGDNLPIVDLGIGRTAITIEAGYNHTTVILDNGDVKVWGNNSFGQLGQGNTDNIGDAYGEMGDALSAIDLGTGVQVLGISGGDNHTSVILDNCTVKTFGYNDYGQLGIGSTTWIGDGSNEMGSNLSAIDLGTGLCAATSSFSITTDFISSSVTFTPANGANDVLLSTNILISFNEAVRKLDNTELTNTNIDALISLKNQDVNGTDIAFDATINSSKTLITITSTNGFTSNQTVYTAIGATVEDGSDNAITATSATFTTRDTYGPDITWSPVDASTNVTVGSNVTITFSELVRHTDDTALSNANVDALITIKDTNASGSDIAFDATVSTSGTGSALSFDGVNDYVRVTTDTDLPLNNTERTMSAWIYDAGDGNSWGSVMHWGGSEHCSGYMWGFGIQSGKLTMWGGCKDWITSLDIPKNEWTFISATYDGSKLRAWVNGVKDSTSASNYQTSTSDLFIGGETINNGISFREFFYGKIDDVSIWDEALDDSEVAAIYGGVTPTSNSGSYTSSSNLVGYWNFNEGSGSIVSDGSATGNSGAISGATWTTASVGGNTVITIDPTNNFGSNQTVYAAIGATIEDFSDNVNTASNITFTTADILAPTISFSPSEGTQGVASTLNVSIHFSEAVRRLDNTALTDLNVDALITLKDTDANGSDIAFDATINAAKNIITIDPVSDFSSVQTVYVAISASVEDESGNAITGANATFVSMDTQGPTYIWNPTSGSTGVPADVNVTLTFTELIRNISDTDLSDTNVDALLTLKETNANGIDIDFDATVSSAGGLSSLYFDGVDDYVKVDREVQDDFTLQAWVKTTTSKTGSKPWHGLPIIYADYPGGTNLDFGTAVLNGKFSFNTGPSDQTIQSTSSIDDGQWHHVVATREKSTGTISVYVNGALENSLVTTNTGSLTLPTHIYIGGQLVNSKYFKGNIKEVAVWASTISSDGVAALYNSGSPLNVLTDAGGYTSSNNVQGYWKFNDGTGFTAADASTSNNDGAINGAVWNIDSQNSYTIITINPTNNFTSSQVVYGAVGSTLEDVSDNVVTASSTTFIVANIDAPRITSGTLASDNSYVLIEISEAVYNTNGGSGALEASDFKLVFNKNDGSATNVTISGISKSDGSALTGGETIIRLNLGVTGTPLGVETVAFYPVDGNSIYDVAGMIMGSAQTTGPLTLNDLSPPIMTFSPQKDATGVGIGSNVTITFSEPVQKIDNSALTDENVDALLTLKKLDISGADIAFNATVSSNKKVITIDPTNYFESLETVYAAIGSSVEDSLGNAIPDSFVTFVISDVDPPTVVFNPAHSDTGAAFNTNIKLTFSEPIRLKDNAPLTDSALDTIITLRDTDSTGSQLQFYATINTPKTIITIDPDEYFSNQQVIYVGIGETVEDTVGNIINPAHAIFTAQKDEPPVVIFNPAHNDINIPVESNITVTLSEPVRHLDNSQITNLSIDELLTLKDTDINGEDLSFDATISEEMVMITIDPEYHFNSQQKIYVAIAAGVEDSLNNAISAQTATFIAQDTQSPSVIFDPSDKSVNVPKDKSITISFSEPVRSISNIPFGDSNVDDVVQLKEINVNGADIPFDATINTAKTVITVDPLSEFDFQKTIYVGINNAIEDTSNNSTKTAYSIFTTIDDTLKGPSIISLNPPDNSTDVNADQNLIIKFDENIVRNTGSIIIYEYINETTNEYEKIDINNDKILVDGNRLVINPEKEYKSLTSYYVLFGAATITDVRGNVSMGILDKDTWNFTIRDLTLPLVTIYPADSLTNVPIDTNVVLTFSEPIYHLDGSTPSLSSMRSNFVFQTNDLDRSQFNVAYDLSSSNSGLTYTLNPKVPFFYAQDYMVSVKNLQDATGNLLQTTSSSFTTVYGYIQTYITTLANPTNSKEIPIEVTFGTLVTDFTLSDIVITGGSGKSFSGGGENYFFVLVPDNEGDISIKVPEKVCHNISNENDVNVAAELIVSYDGSAPTIKQVVDGSTDGQTDKDYQSSKTTYVGSWTVNEDVANIAQFKTALGTYPGGTNIVNWRYIGVTDTIQYDMISLLEGKTYYLSISAEDKVGNTSDILISDGITIDAMKPTIGKVNDGTADDVDYVESKSSITANWYGFRDQTGKIESYNIAIGTLDYSTDIMDWVNTGTIDSSYSKTITLPLYKEIYFLVQAVDEAGNVSSTANSDGFIIDPYLGPPSLKTITPESGSIISMTNINEIKFEFSEPLKTYGVESRSYHTSLYDYTVDSLATELTVTINPPLVSLDTIEINVTTVTDSAGRISSDDFLTFFLTTPLGDVNSDMKINVQDMNQFVSGWKNKDFQYELGPTRGSFPHLIMDGNSVYDLNDAMMFGRFWSWSVENHGISTITRPISALKPSISMRSNGFDIQPPSGSKTGQVFLSYENEFMNVMIENANVTNLSEIILSSNQQDAGQTIYEAGSLSRFDLKSIRVKAEQSENNQSPIFVSYIFYGSGNEIVSEGEQEITLVQIPESFALNQNYPNPFNPLTKIQYQLPYQTDVNLSIYDILGNEVIVLVHQNQASGTYNIIWDAVDRHGREVSGGVYFYRIKTREFTKTKKLILLK